MSGYASCSTQCPSCLMKKENFANIGKTIDKAERKCSQQVDSQEMQKAVLKAWKRIFEQGRPIQSSKFIRNLLQPFGCSATWLVVSTVPLANTSISTVTILIYVWFFHFWRLPSDFCHWSDAWNGAWSHQKHRNVHLQDHLAFWHCRYDGWTVSEISSYGTPDTEWWNI